MHNKEKLPLSNHLVQAMFTSIAPRYDLLNSLLSIGQDKCWRKLAIDKLAPEPNERILDIATGTGDVMLEIVSRNNLIKVLGVDFSLKMLELGRKKIIKKGYAHSVSFAMGTAECLPMAEKTFDGAVCAFGVRNFSNAKLGLIEIFRILKPGGRVVILEFSIPTNYFIKHIYGWYFNKVLPRIGRLISRNNAAYTYLPNSVNNFPDQNKFLSLMKETGFIQVAFRTLCFGIVSIHFGYKTF